MMVTRAQPSRRLVAALCALLLAPAVGRADAPASAPASGQAEQAPPGPTSQPASRPAPTGGRTRYLVGAFGGGQITHVAGKDRPWLTGFLLGVQSQSRAWDIEMDALLPSPIAVDLYLRWYPTRGAVRPFLKGGFVIVWRKVAAETDASVTTSITGYGAAVGAGLAVDLGPSVSLFVQVSAGYLITADGNTAGWRGRTLFPALAGLLVRL
jgi:hypothetical protein